MLRNNDIKIAQTLAFGEPKCGNDAFDDVIALAYVSHIDVLDDPIPKDKLEGGLWLGLSFLDPISRSNAPVSRDCFCFQRLAHAPTVALIIARNC